jgi:hypothetical protein
VAPCPVCAEKLSLQLLVSGSFCCPRCHAPLQSNAFFALNFAGAISGPPAVLLSLVCENFMWPSVTFVTVFALLASSLSVLLVHARRDRDRDYV